MRSTLLFLGRGIAVEIKASPPSTAQLHIEKCRHNFFRTLGTGLEKESDEDMAFELILSLSFQGGRQTAPSCDTAWQSVATDAQKTLRDLRVRAWFRGELRRIASVNLELRAAES